MATHNEIGNVSPWITRYADQLPAGGPVLDVACGSGRHLRYFRARGHTVTGIDIDLAGVADLVNIAGEPGTRLIQHDLEAPDAVWPVADTRFGGVIVTNYLWRPLLAQIIAAVAPGGALIYETFMRGQERLGGPKNPDFLLRPGELRDAVDGHLTVIGYEEIEETTPVRAIRQRICAVCKADS